LLGRPSQDELIEGLRGAEGPTAQALRAYADSAGRSIDGLADHFTQYIDLSRFDIEPASRHARTAMQVRDQLKRRVSQH
jgi:hypothetical protein